MADIQYDPACIDCRHDAVKDPAGTTWQCNGHVRAERDWLRAKLANGMVEWKQTAANLQTRADGFEFLRELLVAVVKTGTKDPLLDARITEELRSHE